MATEWWSVVMAKVLYSHLESVPLITMYIYNLGFVSRSFVVRIKYVNRSSRELEHVYLFLCGETAMYRRLQPCVQQWFYGELILCAY